MNDEIARLEKLLRDTKALAAQALNVAGEIERAADQLDPPSGRQRSYAMTGNFMKPSKLPVTAFTADIERLQKRAAARAQAGLRGAVLTPRSVATVTPLPANVRQHENGTIIENTPAGVTIYRDRDAYERSR